ncbi:MAG: hypothetical protein PHC92_09140 [Syntrophomonadaceae bacterium]|nr:hypothetical protein [Syntrophomonadaceae bacterium]MDD3024674.1 hypothetical protein [Syntrophomonadaceae bacterium]
MKKAYFILYLSASVLTAVSALIQVWRVIPGNEPEHASLFSQMFGPIFGTIFYVGILLVLCIIFAKFAKEEYSK